MNKSTELQETLITIYSNQNECYVMTSDSAYIEILDKLCEEAPESYKLVNVGKYNEAVFDKEYVINSKSLIRFLRSEKHVL